MAAVTPNLFRNLGSLGPYRLVMARFSTTTVNDADTYASGLKAVFAYWAQQKDNPTTQASAGVAIAVSGATFTFYPGEEGAEVDLFILTGS